MLLNQPHGTMPDDNNSNDEKEKRKSKEAIPTYGQDAEEGMAAGWMIQSCFKMPTPALSSKTRCA